MADQDILHTAEIMKAAIPFVDARSKAMGELFVKVFELMGAVKYIRNPSDMTALGLESYKLDMEGLLNGIRPVCNHKEREFIDRILNFFSMKRMFEMYNNMMETMRTMQEFNEGFDDSDTDADTDTVKGNFAGSNFESIFNTFMNVSNIMNSQAMKDDIEPEEKEEQNDDEDIDESDENEDRGETEDKDITEDEIETDDWNKTEDKKETDDETITENGSSEDNDKNEDGSIGSKKDKGVHKASGIADRAINKSNTGTRNNDMMMELLKSMVPQDKVSTIESLSMLFNNMSYDNNSKTDQKERNDG